MVSLPMRGTIVVSLNAGTVTLTLSLNRGVEVAEVLGFPRAKSEGKIRIRLGDTASGGRSLAGFKIRLVQEPEKEWLLAMGSLSIGCNSVGGEIGRVRCTAEKGRVPGRFGIEQPGRFESGEYSPPSTIISTHLNNIPWSALFDTVS